MAALVLVGCGGSAVRRASARSTPCTAAARGAIAGFLGVPSASIAHAVSTGNNAMPQCSFTARTTAHQRVDLVANVDNGPQPYFRLERTEVEASQMFTPNRSAPAPEAITDVGIEADWFPAAGQLMATDGVRLITITVTWRHAKVSRQIALAESLTRTYLRHPKDQASLAKSYP